MAKTQQGFRKTLGAESASIPTSHLAKLTSSWLIVGDISRHSDRYLESRKDLMGKLLWFLETKKLDECDTDSIRLFMQHVQHGHKEPGGRWGNPRMTRPTKPRTSKNYYGILRSFFNWCISEGELTQSPMDRISVPVDRADQVQPFTEDQMRRLLAAAKKTLHPKRDEAILLLLLDTGMRASELCELKMRDVDLQNGYLTVEGKGGKQRRLPFSRDTKRALYNYLNEADEREQNTAVFLSDRGTAAGEGLTRHGLRFLIIRIGKAAGIDGARCSPHTFRHTHAIEFLRAGGNQFTLQQILGHTHLAMTARYVAIAQADVEAQHRMFSPVARLRGGQK